MLRYLLPLAAVLTLLSPPQESTPAKPGDHSDLASALAFEMPPIGGPPDTIFTDDKVDHPKTVIETDHEFDAGSGIKISDLSKLQVDNLEILGRIWGFLKYHHPKVTTGERHWDYDLFRILPSILAAPDRKAAQLALQKWIADLGPVTPCAPCAQPNEKDLYFRPDLDWISNESLLGADLSRTLRSIRDNRLADKQFYVSKVEGIGNPKFEHELAYNNLKIPDPGFQLLALYRYWNIVEYWSPYRDLSADWNSVLSEFIPRIALAKDSDSYRRELMALIAKLRDGHSNLWNALDARPPAGKCQIPVNVRFIDQLPVVYGFPGTDHPAGLELGDIITEVDGVSISNLVESWKPYYAASNDTARLRDMAHTLTRGDCGDSTLGVRREGHELKLKVPRSSPYLAATGLPTYDLPGPTFRLLSKDVAYIKLSSIKSADVASYVKQAADTKGLIIDIRNYPSDFVVFELGSHLVDHETPFVTFTESDLSNPGAFHWAVTVSVPPSQPHYTGKIVILEDESSMSQAEYTAMAFRSAPGAIVVGSTTSGADGNVSILFLPGGLSTAISGIGVFYPDKSPTQQIGIKPDVRVTPTSAGIRAGRDEVLEEAVRQILGPATSQAEIEKLAKP